MPYNYDMLLDVLDREVSRETYMALEAYASLLCKWNHSINLISKQTEPIIWQRHILDSVQLVPLILKDKASLTIADFGSGAGLPGLVVACVLDGLGVDYHLHMIESDRRKTIFLHQAVGALSIDAAHITIHNERVEHLEPWNNDIILARGFAPLDKLFAYIVPFAGKKCLSLLQKGSRVENELEVASKLWKFDYQQIPSKIADDSIILAVTDIGSHS